jgi:hypothetical protein
VRWCGGGGGGGGCGVEYVLRVTESLNFGLTRCG